MAPASEENLAATVRKRVHVADIESKLDVATKTKLLGVLGRESSFHCWAMTSSRRGFYEKMGVGDAVLFTPKGTGRFTYQATVRGKLESQPLGELLWTVVPGKPWSLIYFVDDVKSVSIKKRQLLNELGYSPKFDLPGIQPADSEKLGAAIRRHGSLKALLESASA